MAERAAREIPLPDEGDLDADLHALAGDVVASLCDPALKAALGAMVTEAAGDPAAREVLSRFLAGRAATMTVIIDRAVARGELPPHTGAAGVIGTVTAVITDAVEQIIGAQGELRSFRIFRQQPAQRRRNIAAQLHRFMGTRSGRKSQYARLLAGALDLARTPLALDCVLVPPASPCRLTWAANDSPVMPR